MKWIEVTPIPEECKSCTESDCYACDIAGKRWVLSKEDELRSNRALMVRATDRLQRKIAAIDLELENLRETNDAQYFIFSPHPLFKMKFLCYNV